MNTFLAMKGEGVPLAMVSTAAATTELCRYADGSYAVIHRGRPVGMWEAQDVGDCLHTFLKISHVNEMQRDFVLFLKSENDSILIERSIDDLQSFCNHEANERIMPETVVLHSNRH